MRRTGKILPNRRQALAASVFILAAGVFSSSVLSHDELNGRPHHIDAPVNPTAAMRAFNNSKAGQTEPVAVNAAAPEAECTGNMADIYPCSKVDLRAFMPRDQFGGDRVNDEINDIWGWTDPDDGREYALIGRVFGTSFIDITDPDAPIYVGELPLHGNFGSSWRDIKVYRNHAFMVSEARNDGMQVFDLTRLRTATGGTTFTEDAHYNGFGSAHNLVINEESGFAYAVGTNTCSGGLEMVDIRDPLNPTDAGCYSGDGYTHDAQCVIYRGADTDAGGASWAGSEICFASNEDSLTIVDVSDKSNPQLIAKSDYLNSEYTHQGWLNEDHSLFFFDDELDEINNANVTTTTTRTWDISDLEGIGSATVSTVEFGNASIDHNLYVEGRFIYQANYRSGLQILEMNLDPTGDILTGDVAAYFDVYPDDDFAEFNGAWSNYPYFASGNVVVSHIEQGLFVLTPNIDRVTFTSIDHGDVLSGDVSVFIDARDADAAGAPSNLVSFEIDGVSLGDPAVLHPPNVWDTVAEDDGLHRLTARMVDAAGTETSSTILVTIENGGANIDPVVSITSPADDDEVSGNISLAANASDIDGSVVSVEFFDTPDGSAEVSIGFASQSGDNWTMSWNTKKVAKSAHALRAEAIDDDGAMVSSGSISITVVSGGGGGGGGGGGCPPKKPGCS